MRVFVLGGQIRCVVLEIGQFIISNIRKDTKTNAKTMKKIALLSVFNKQGIVGFAQKLIAHGYEIWSSGGTAKMLSEHGVPVTDVATLVGKPILGHKVVTLSRQIHAALLCDLENESEVAELKAEGISPIHLVCCDLYPLQQAIAEQKLLSEVVALTDIGGPTMISSAAKAGRIVVCDFEDRERTLVWLEKGMPNASTFLQELRAKADLVVSMYRMLSASYHSHGTYQGSFSEKTKSLRYGENPHQGNAALYAPLAGEKDQLGFYNFDQIEGAEPSLINHTDLSAATNVLNLAALTLTTNGLWSNDTYIAVVVKHGTPCGFGYAVGNKTQALKNMVAGDPQAAFGGAVVTNFPLDYEDGMLLKNHLLTAGQKRIYDLIAVPALTDDTVTLLARKDDKCRIFTNSYLKGIHLIPMPTEQVERQIRGGKVMCNASQLVLDMQSPKVDVTLNKNEEFNPTSLADLCIAHAICATSKSNTITFVKDGVLLANASGQQSRVHCAKLATAKLKEFHPEVFGFTAASDSFFPAEDGVEVIIRAGAGTIFTTTGSKADEKVMAMIALNKIRLVTMKDSEGRLFYGHC